METFTLLLSSLLYLLLLVPAGECTPRTPRSLNLTEALRHYGLECYAEFLLNYPTPEMYDHDIIVFAPTNKAVQDYLKANPDPVDGLRRRADAAKNAANKNNMASGAAANQPFSSSPPKGAVLATGAGGKSGTKVSKPVPAGGSRKARGISCGGRCPDYPSYPYYSSKPVGRITAGGGGVTYVLTESKKFDNGIIYPVDGFFSTTGGGGDAISSAGLTYLEQIFDRLPHARDAILGAEAVTFLAPTQEAFDRSGLHPYKSKTWELKKFLGDHTLAKGFLGYTPSFDDGKCYKTVSGSGITTQFNGTHTIINKYAVIVGEDHIIDNGVIQIIDKVLYPPRKSYKQPTECYKR